MLAHGNPRDIFEFGRVRRRQLLLDDYFLRHGRKFGVKSSNHYRNVEL